MCDMHLLFATHLPAQTTSTGSTSSVSSVPLGALPNFGGRTSEGTIASHQRWGIERVPTPREIVAMLDQYVVGQAEAKKVLAVAVSWGGGGSLGCFSRAAACYRAHGRGVFVNRRCSAAPLWKTGA